MSTSYRPIESGKPPLDRQRVLANHPFFKGLDDSIIAQLGPRTITRHLNKGGVLFRKGEPGSSLYAIVRGAIRISAPCETGGDAVLNLMMPGDVFGEIAMLDGGTRTADATAIEACDLLVMERRDFLPLVRSHPDLAIRLIEVLCGRVRHTSEQVEDVMYLDLPNRLAKALLLLDMRSRGGAAQQQIRITQRELSQMIGASRESTNKQLRSWEKQNILHIERARVVVLQRAALEKIIEAI
ncbi:MAG TPA: Crp/Fnr family transcriptional regulator [Acidobacteriaceae bacterium]|nr:Crp/Fnr family transcriptional regulator [Acidobacteriaceae bacterium]